MQASCTGGVPRWVSGGGGGAECGVPDSEKNFIPQRTTSKTAAGDRGELVKGLSHVVKQMEMKELMILMVVAANFWGRVFCSGKWLWKEKSTEAVLVFLKTRVGCVSTRRKLPEEGKESLYEEAGVGVAEEEGGPGPPGV